MLHFQATGVNITEGRQKIILFLYVSGPDTHVFNCFQLKQVGKLLIIQNLRILHSIPKKWNIQDLREVKTWKNSLPI